LAFEQSFKEFEKNVLVHDFWRFYKVEAVLGRTEPTGSWKVLFLFISLDTQGHKKYDTLFESDYLRVIEESHESKYLRDFLITIFDQSSVELREHTSLEFMHDRPVYESINREKAYKTIGIGFSGKALYLKGGHSEKLQAIEEYISQRLLVEENPPYINLDDLLRERLKISRPWDYEGTDFESRLLFIAFAPNFFRLEKPVIKDNDLHVRVSTLRKPKGSVKVSVIGQKGGEITYRNHIEFNEDDWQNGELTKILLIDELSTVVHLWLSYNGNLVEQLTYERTDKVLQRTLWIRTLVKSVDPDYTTLERWITGTSNVKRDSNKLSADFEEGISNLFSLCGLNTVHIGNTYEQATQKSKALLQSSRMEFPVDVLTWWSSRSDGREVLYLVQCTLAGSGDKLMTKINDVASAVTIANNILSDHLTKPKIVPVVVTNMTRLDTVYEQKQAADRGVKIVSKEDLMFLLHGIRNDDPFANNEVRNILQGSAAITRPKTKIFEAYSSSF
jgi:hypothetical protein